MAYVPDPTNVNQPVESVFAKTAAAEFRALKAYIQTLVLGTGQLAGFRNMSRNSDFSLSRRSTGVMAVNNGFIVDGWQLFNTGVNRLNGQRDSATHAAVMPFMLRLFTVASAAPAAGEIYGTFSKIEGINTAPLQWGTANAKPITVSFQIYSQVAGTFALSFRNNAGTRSYVTPITVVAPNTFETKTVTIPGDTAGTWQTGNLCGIDVALGLAVGSTFQTATPDTWLAGNFVGLSTQTQLTSSVSGSTVWLGQFQFEQSTFATPFEFTPYSARIKLEERYWINGTSGLSGNGAVGIGEGYRQPFPSLMRAVPTLNYTIVTNVNCTVLDVRAATTDSLEHFCTVIGAGGYIGVLNWTASAEMP